MPMDDAEYKCPECRAQMAKHKCRCFDQLEKQCERRRWTIVHRFVIPYVGWELDNQAVVARDEEGSLHVMTTSHTGIRVDGEITEHRDNAVRWLHGLETAVKLLGDRRKETD